MESHVDDLMARDEACCSMLRGGYTKKPIHMMRENYPEIKGPPDFEG